MQKFILLLLLEVSLFAASRYGGSPASQVEVPPHETPPTQSPGTNLQPTLPNTPEPNANFEPPFQIWKRLKKEKLEHEQLNFLSLLWDIEHPQQSNDANGTGQRRKDLIGPTFYTIRGSKGTSPPQKPKPEELGADGSKDNLTIMRLRLEKLSREGASQLSNQFVNGSSKTALSHGDQ